MPGPRRRSSMVVRRKRQARSRATRLRSSTPAVTSSRRCGWTFWEQDDNIYGGLAWTDRANENLIYPSHGFGAPDGVLVAAYVNGWTNRDNPQKFAAFSNAE